jgi:hypothetical protein
MPEPAGAGAFAGAGAGAFAGAGFFGASASAILHSRQADAKSRVG